VTVTSLWMLCAWLFVDGVTFGVLTTPLLLLASRQFAPWQVALYGAIASSAGSALQLWLLRWLIRSDRPWMRRWVPSREKIEATLAKYPSTSFAALLIARATPLPDAPLKIVAAVVEYPIPLYTLAVLLGSLPYYFALAWIGHQFQLPLSWVAGIAAVFVVAFLVDRLRRRRGDEA
jgi:uncharacterized membrane protein YdjX (TVP38/TMEM64 family)